LEDVSFDDLVAEAIDALPKKYGEALENVAFVTEDFPNPNQRKKVRLRCDQTLFGLYEGVPRTSRGNNYSGVLPDKITIFRIPILSVSRTLDDVKKQVKRTVWHEVAHHYGLGHDEIHRLEASILKN
jgi:predicted Zn-dependent protease with MMP-like domain